MARALTAIAIANLKPRPTRYEVSDPGCAGLRASEAHRRGLEPMIIKTPKQAVEAAFRVFIAICLDPRRL
jgi:hypothetical protein